MFEGYALSKDRFKELKHFCRQYGEYLERYIETDDAAEKADLIIAIELIEKTARSASEKLSSYILEYVTTDSSLTEVDAPVDPLIFRYFTEKFYWLLSERKGV